MNIGYILEHNVRTKDGRELPPAIICSADYGQQAFDDLTRDQPAGTVKTDHDIEGIDPDFEEPVTYDRTFVVLSSHQ